MRSLLNCCLYLLLIMIVPISGTAQTQAQIQEGKAKLGTMSPAEIDAKIKELGMTRAEADAKAQQYGVDLESYLRKSPAHTAAPTQPQPQPQTTVIVQQPTPAVSSAQTAPTDSLAAAAPLQQTPTVSLVAQESASKNLPPITPAEQQVYGLSFFRRAASSFQPSPSIVDKEYILGAGDVLKISLWGQLQSTQEVEVAQDGTITLTTGPVLVSGYSIYEAKKRIIAALSQAFAGLVSNPPSIYFDLSLSKLRPVRVFFLGEVENPGGYFVNNFASVFNSLFVVGGPKASGSMRDVRVIKNNKVVRRVDLYDYLNGAQKTSDARVNDNDIIFVPLRGRTVGITGEVLRPAKYELLPDENLRKLVEFSGGLRTNMYLERAQVSRIIPFNERVKGELERRVFDIDLRDIVNGGKDYRLEDGDVITLFPILERHENYVRIDGAVYRPGTYQKEKVNTIRDLIKAADNLLPEAYLERGELTRTYPDKRRVAYNFNVALALKGNPEHNLLLTNLDEVRIYSRYEINPLRTISISGHVKNPGSFPYADSLTLYDILFTSGGLQDSMFRAQTYLERGSMARLNSDLQTRYMIYFNVADVFDNKIGNIPLEQGDEIRIYSWDEMRESVGTVEIQGKAKRPGVYPIRTNLTLYDLVYDAVGLTDTLFRKEVLLETADLIRLNSDRHTTRIVRFDLWRLFTERSGDTTLLAGDRIIIYPKTAVEISDKYVEIFGSVRTPGRYILAENMSIVDLLLQAGGYTEDAYAVQAEIARISRKGLGKDSLVFSRFAELPDLFDTSASKIEILRKTRVGSYHLQNKDQVFIRPNPEYVKQQLVTIGGEVQHPGQYALNIHAERLSHAVARAGGLTLSGYARGARLTRDNVMIRLNIEEALDDEEGPNDVVLKPGDIISVPKKPGIVTIHGEVQNPGVYGYVRKESLSDYLDRAGGETDSSDFAVITFPEGDSKQVGLGWFASNPTIPDGSDIVVTREPPEKPKPPEVPGEKTDTLGLLKDITYMTITVLTVLILSKQVK